ncbi:MAG: GNAT family N-acetyltransferase [Eggerthella lenta]
MSAGRPAGRFVLETERLLLREMGQSDLAALCAILQDDETMTPPRARCRIDEAQARLDRQMGAARGGWWAVVLRNGRRSMAHLSDADGVRVVEVGYLFRRSFWHRGYATEAARVCRDYAFDQVGVDTVYSIIRDTNIPSQKVALRNGMKPEGSFVKRYRDVDMPHIVYAVSRAVRDGVY